MSELVAEATAAVANVAIEGEQPKGPSKAELKKLAKKAEKEAKKAEYKAKEAAEKGISAPGTSSSKESGDAESDALAHLYGDAPLICSKTMTDRVFKNIEDLSVEKDADTVIWMRARVHTSRAVSKGVFLLLRQQVHTIQAIAWQGAEVPKALIKYAASLPLESVIDGKNCISLWVGYILYLYECLYLLQFVARL